MKSVLVDTGVWIALFNPKDQHHNEAEEKVELLKALRIVLPWPTVYETLRTRFVNNIPALGQFELFLKRPGIDYFDDSKYRQDALRLSFNSSLRRVPPRPLSMDDCLLRLIIEDKKSDVLLSYLATFNRKDFIDVCQGRRVEFL